MVGKKISADPTQIRLMVGTFHPSNNNAYFKNKDNDSFTMECSRDLRNTLKEKAEQKRDTRGHRGQKHYSGPPGPAYNYQMPPQNYYPQGEIHINKK